MLKLLISSILFFITSICYGNTLCKQNEEIIAQCTLGNGKQASICKRNISNDTFQVQYRFGTNNNIEFQYPEKPNKASKELFKFSRFKTHDYPNGEYRITFKNGEYSYIFHQWEDINIMNNKTVYSYNRAGVSIQKDNKGAINHLNCTESPTNKIIRDGVFSLKREDFNNAIDY